MQEKATQFIDLLERKQLLAPEIVEELRRQVEEAKTRLTPELLAKLLVDNGHLTKFQATKLIAEAKEQSDPSSQADVPGGPVASTPSQDDELGFAPDPDAPSAEEESAAEVEDDAPVAAVFIDEEDGGDSPVVAVEAPEVEVGEVELGEVEVAMPVEAEPLAPTPDVFSAAPARPARSVQKKMPQVSPWESYRILGRGVVLALLLIALVVLVLYFWRGSAEDHLRRADDLYESRGYETAAGLYEEFYERWPTHEKASYAKVRSVLASLRGATELAPDPMIGLEKVLELVPGLAGEPGLPDQQSDLAGVLISLAEKFNERADNTQDTEKRKTLMKEMEKLLELINNPQFVGPTQRSQQAPTLQRIAEDRQRILREINRDEELMRALAEMDKLLEAEDTLAAYQVRAELIDRYPLLEAHPEVIRRVYRATEILKSQVQSASLAMERSDSPPPIGPRQVTALTHHRGAPVADLAGEVLFCRAGGAVYGLDGKTGAVQWRRFVGRGLEDSPLRLGKGSAVDALIWVPRAGQLMRLDGRTGQPEWYVDLDAQILQPTAESDDVFVVTTDGRVASLDAVSGQARWIRQLPQPVEVPAGAALGKPHVYVLGEHSNLYVLSRRDGACQQVVYTGHRKGSIAVPPVLLLGQLFLFENITPDNGKIRILSASDEGVGLEDAQLPIPVDGNVVLVPTIAGRRMVVHSDLGQILVLDIEPTEEKDKVVIAAKIPKNLFAPQLAWSVFDNNVLWVADKRFTRFNYQVSLGKLDRAWIKDDGDLFVDAPLKFGEWIVHVRRLRGGQGVRVAAVDAEKGDPAWETDLGVPVVWIGEGAGGVHAITSAAMLFGPSDAEVVAQASLDAGQGKPQLAMRDPVTLSGGGVVLVNGSRSNQIAVYTPGPRPSLELLLANLGTARPACPPVAVGDLIALGLNNGQFVLVDPANGAQPVAPYQPPMEPGKKVVWNRPAFLPGAETLIVSNSLQKLVRLSTEGALRPLTEADLENPFDGPLAVSGPRVFGVVASPGGDSIEAYDVISLEKQARLALTGRRAAGPFVAPGSVIVQTNTHLMAVDEECKELWKVPAPDQPLFGPPVVVGDAWVFAFRDGTLWKIGASTGRVEGTYDVLQGIAAPVVNRDGDLLLGSDEGTVVTVPMSDFEGQ